MSPFTGPSPRQHPYYTELLHHIGTTRPKDIGVITGDDPDGCRWIKVIFPAPTHPEENLL